MSEPRVPGGRGEELSLSCGESVHVHDLDLGMRELDCGCGAAHAVVTDVNPPTRFFPTFMVETLRETVETDDEYDALGTVHLMGMVLEEFPDAVAATDVADDGEVGYAMVWVTDFDDRRLHEVVVELVVELMEHAVSHADDEYAMTSFEQEMLAFDVAEFVAEYRARRDLEDEHDTML